MAAAHLLGAKSRINWLQGGHGLDLIVTGLALVLPPLVVLAPLGMTPLLVITALAALLPAAGNLAPTLRRFVTIAALLGVLGIWGAASVLWSAIPEHSFVEGVRFLGESASGLCLLVAASGIASGTRARRAHALAAGLVVALALLAIERFGGTPVMHWWHGTPESQFETLAHYDRGVTALVLLMAPVAVGAAPVWRRALLLAAIVAAAAMMQSASALMAALVTLIVYAIGRLTPRLTAATMMAGMVAIGVAIPLATPSYDSVVTLHTKAPWIKYSGIHRLLIWRFAADRVAERPLIGWGMDASRAIPGGKSDFNDMLPALHYPAGAEALPLHPHDAALQLQLELGIPGLAFGLWIVCFVVYRVGWRAELSAHERAAALALCSGAVVVALLSFGIWQTWWQSTLWLVVSLYMANARQEGEANRKARAGHQAR